MHYTDYPFYKLITYSYFWISHIFGLILIYFSNQIYLGVFISTFIFVSFLLMLITNILSYHTEEIAIIPLLFGSILCIVGSIYYLYIRTIILIKQKNYNVNIEQYFSNTMQNALKNMKYIYIANSVFIIIFTLLFYTTIPYNKININFSIIDSNFYTDDYGFGNIFIGFKYLLSIAIILLGSLQIYYGDLMSKKLKKKINIPDEKRKTQTNSFINSVLFWINPFKIANYFANTYYEFRT